MESGNWLQRSRILKQMLRTDGRRTKVIRIAYLVIHRLSCQLKSIYLMLLTLVRVDEVMFWIHMMSFVSILTSIYVIYTVVFYNFFQYFQIYKIFYESSFLCIGFKKWLIFISIFWLIKASFNKLYSKLTMFCIVYGGRQPSNVFTRKLHLLPL